MKSLKSMGHHTTAQLEHPSITIGGFIAIEHPHITQTLSPLCVLRECSITMKAPIVIEASSSRTVVLEI